MFGWLRSREVEEFGASLAGDIVSRCPPAQAHEGDRISMQLAKAIDEACARAQTYHKEQRLGMYGKAKLATAFKYALRETGYPQELVDSVTRQLLLKMSAG